MEGITVQKPLFRIRPLFGRLFVNGSGAFEGCYDMLTDGRPPDP